MLKTTSKETLINSVKALQEETVAIRRDLHQIPELGWEEEKTLAYIKERVESYIEKSPYTCRIIEMRGGLVVDVDANDHSKRILFRADCDALPIEEKTGVPYASKHPGIMHACGHDAHSAMLLSAFKLLTSGDIPPHANLRFVWQRCEESPFPQSGGTALVEEGVCEGVDSVYGIHIISNEPSGVFQCRPGVFWAEGAQIDIEVGATGGHVMNPHLGSNAIDIITDIHTALRDFVAKSLDPEETCCLVPSISNSGAKSNIRPNIASATYAFRHFLDDKAFDSTIERLQKRIVGVAEGYEGGSLVKFEVQRGYPQVINCPNAYSRTNSLLESVDIPTRCAQKYLAGEDFSYYLKERPGAFWCLGADAGKSPNHHTPEFEIDEKVLWQGVAFFTLIASQLES